MPAQLSKAYHGVCPKKKVPEGLSPAMWNAQLPGPTRRTKDLGSFGEAKSSHRRNKDKNQGRREGGREKTKVMKLKYIGEMGEGWNILYLGGRISEAGVDQSEG
jgi:hypothetical protein